VNNGVQFSPPPLTPFVKRLIITLASAFVAELVLENFLHIEIIKWLALSPSSLGIQTLWQVVTYVLVEGRPNDLLISLVFIWLLVSPFELRYGRRRAMEISALSVVAAACAAIIAAFVAPASPLVGSQAITYAIMAATCWSAKHDVLRLFFLFRLTGLQALAGLAGFALLWFLYTMSYTHLVAAFAALGAGVGYVEWMRKGPAMFRRSTRPGRGGLRAVRGGRDSERPKWLN